MKAQQHNPANETTTTHNTFARALLAWFDRHGRHNLPWQQRSHDLAQNAYHIWLAEIMLQQTQVSTVIPYFQNFINTLPTLHALAQAKEDTVLALWSGLGYYRRARFLQRAARICMTGHDGALPCDFNALHALPGIGRSTAGAILAQVWGQRFPVLDGNVRRVLSRYHGIHGNPNQSAVQKKLWQYADSHTPNQQVANYTQAIMDLGATVCVRTRPQCDRCPLQPDCLAHRHDLTMQLPTPRPHKVLPEHHTVMLMLREAKSQVMLERRRHEQGVWSGLWSLPEVDDTAAAWQLAQQYATIASARALPPFTHVFSHYRLYIEPWLFNVATRHPMITSHNQRRWFDAREQMTLGLPSPVRRLLQRISEG